MKKNQLTNHLINESSPYLRQHAHNPVDWYPWGTEALTKAKNENKLIIISIGYAACHWCHVMEYESFENEEVAKLMNEHFISIKVDREERPDIDQIYMDAVQLLTGRGGWPLNAIALPDQRPIYAGTYFRKDQWMSLLQQIIQFVNNHPDKVEEQAKAVTEGILRSELIVKSEALQDFTSRDIDAVFTNIISNVDKANGGFGAAPKFPMPVGLQFLLQYAYYYSNNNALIALNSTLDKMASGGIYDQIGGGFARYSTDAYWNVPHFEKMLYDNAQLASLYSNAYQYTKDENYKTVVNKTLDFIKRELTSKEGGFYSSLDADSEGEEGKYYVWTKDEIEKQVGKNAPIYIDYYGITENGNWEHGKNILIKSKNIKRIVDKYNITEHDLNEFIHATNFKLLNERLKRIKPGLDDKILTAWNALMSKGYIDAYKAFGDVQYLSAAIKNVEFILKNLKSDDNRLYRNHKNGISTINGFLDDYAFTIDALISLYQVTFRIDYLHQAKNLLEHTINHFYNDSISIFYYTSDIDPKLIARKTDITDNVIPSANSAMAKNLYIFGHYYYNDEYIEMSKRMISNIYQRVIRGGIYYANWASLLFWFSEKPYEVAILGEEYTDVVKEFNNIYLPNIFLSGGNKEGTLKLHDNKIIQNQTTIYVCQDKTCKLPVNKTEEAIDQIR